MPFQPPSFGSRQYWNDRFTSNSNPFEWLEAPDALDPYLVDALKETPDQNPEVLHIGCGTSLLSYHLRAHVKQPEQIHHLDYSEVAIEVGRKREVEIFHAKKDSEEESDINSTLSDEVEGNNTTTTSNGNKDPTKSLSQLTLNETSSTTYMRWSSANLLSHASLLNACKPSTYSVIVDKSTSDSIACTDDTYVPLPYHVNTSPRPSTPVTQSPEPVHPVHILAIHLALVAKPKARWIALSYSAERFPFLDRPLYGSTSPNLMSEIASALALHGFDGELDDDLDNIPQQMINSGLPDPSTLWTLAGKYEIEVPQQETKNGDSMTTITHRPKVLHWVYVLERTDVEVFVKGQ